MELFIVALFLEKSMLTGESCVILWWQMDVVSHRIVTALGGAASGKTVEDKMQDANVACRKLASEHPLLILRWPLSFSIKLYKKTRGILLNFILICLTQVWKILGFFQKI